MRTSLCRHLSGEVWVTLYTSSREELTRLAHLSRAKENASDYTPLFEQVGEHEQRLQNPNPVFNIDYRAVGERIGKRIAEQLAAVESGNPDEHRTSNPLGAGRAGFEQGFEELAAALELHLEPLADAIAGYHEQRDLLRCAGDLANAAAPIQLSPRQRYQKMWARYSQGVEADTPVRLDYRVCRKAFEDGQSFKDVALMLAAGSSYVQWMAQVQGKEKSRVYVNQTARQACQKEKKLTRPQKQKQAGQPAFIAME